MSEQSSAPAVTGTTGGTALAATAAATAVRQAPAARVAAPAGPPPVAVPDTFTFTTAPTGRSTSARARAAAVPLAPLWGATALCVAVLTGFFVLIVSGRVVTEGPVVAVLTRTHGIHLGDLFALGLWCAATGALVLAAATTTAAVRAARG